MRVLIAGQGFAGSLLAWFLYKNNIDFTVVDPADEKSSTAVAAGIMLPFTGRRLVKTYHADIIIPYAQEVYNSIEELIGIKFYEPKQILQLFSSPGNRNDWFVKSEESHSKKFIGDIINSSQIPVGITAELGGIFLEQSGYVAANLFISAIREWLVKQNKFIQATVENDSLELKNEEIKTPYGNFTHLIFCDGFHSMLNGYFSYLPFNPAKGEILDFYSEQLTEKYIINNGIYILPVGNHFFRAGSTYIWNDLSSTPTKSAAEFLENEIKKTISLTFEITGHKAAIRPTTKDRRPFLGLHPLYKNIGIFNGLGTKGAMLGPYYASQMVNYLITGEKPDRDVNIERFL